MPAWDRAGQRLQTVKGAAAPDATIIVLGYPRVYSGASCFGTLGISATEEQKANTLTQALDTVIANHATTASVTYENALDAFNGHTVCSTSPWLNGLTCSTRARATTRPGPGTARATCRWSPRSPGSTARVRRRRQPKM